MLIFSRKRLRRVLLRKALEKRLLKDVSLQRLEKKTAERYLQKRREKRLQMKILLRSLKIYSLSVLGAGIAPVDLTTISSLRACWTLKTVVECKFLTSPSNPFVTSLKTVVKCNSCARRATFSSLRVCRTRKNVVKCKFLSSPSDPLVTSCVSDAVKWAFFRLAEQPLRHFVRVGRSKLWYCGGVVAFLWLFLWLRFVFWWWCGNVFVVVLLCFCGVVVFLCFCVFCVFVFLWLLFLWWCGCVFVVVWL